MFDLDEIKNACSIRNVSPSELIKQDKTPKEYLDNLNKLKKKAEYDLIIEGSKKGLTAYQRPKSGIPIEDLSLELQKLLYEIYNNNTLPVDNLTSFGQVYYNKAARTLVFYSASDTNLSHPLAIVDTSKFTRGEAGPRGPKGEKGEKGDPGPGITPQMLSDLEQATINASLANELVQLTAELILSVIENTIPHIVLEESEYDSLQDKSDNVLYLIYEDDNI